MIEFFYHLQDITVSFAVMSVIPAKEKEVNMDSKELKKILASLGIVGLLAGASLTLPGCATTGKSG